ncbi:50S ribosomal protein L4 [archaeon]|jgi:large subunit ribosomal protein L4e|nr:50S ribosomal protein L4 [archaeon]NHV06245.1 50S ribosomal protein L4 [Nitrososphaerota archaeon]
MSEVPVLSSEGKEASRTGLPWFMALTPDRTLVKRVFFLLFSGWHQPQGRDPMAGKRYVAKSWGADHGLARVPRLHSGKAIFAPSTVKGRLTHPPRAEKVIVKRVNKKEKAKALLFAIAATANKELVVERGHRVPDSLTLPILFDSSVSNFTKASQVVKFLESIGLSEELERVKNVKLRAGVSARRGRGKKRKVGPLFVVTKEEPLFKAARNIPGVDVVDANLLSLRELAPNGRVGRLTLWSQKALEVLEQRVRKYAEKVNIVVS